MSTTPVPAPSVSFWSKLKPLLPVIEQAVNVGLLASGFGAPFEPLIAGLESSTQSLVQSIGTKESVETEVMAVYGASIGVLTTLKQTPGLPAATLAEVDGYILSAEQGTAAYIQAESGFNPANYTPVTPIA